MHERNIRLDFGGVIPGNDSQHERVRDSVRIPGLRLDRLVQRRLGLFHASEVQLSDSLRDERAHGRGGGRLGELLEDVERLLVLLTTLYSIYC